jgi:hypothetical protein
MMVPGFTVSSMQVPRTQPVGSGGAQGGTISPQPSATKSRQVVAFWSWIAAITVSAPSAETNAPQLAWQLLSIEIAMQSAALLQLRSACCTAAATACDAALDSR